MDGDGHRGNGGYAYRGCLARGGAVRQSWPRRRRRPWWTPARPTTIARRSSISCRSSTASTTRSCPSMRGAGSAASCAPVTGGPGGSWPSRRHTARRRGGGALRPRGADHRPPPAPGHRPGLRGRPLARRRAVLRHEAGRGALARRRSSPTPHASTSASRLLAARARGRRGDRLRPQQRRHPPRPQAGQRAGRPRSARRWSSTGAWPRTCARVGDRAPASARAARRVADRFATTVGARAGHAGVHGARAGARRSRSTSAPTSTPWAPCSTMCCGRPAYVGGTAEEVIAQVLAGPPAAAGQPRARSSRPIWSRSCARR